MNNPELEYPIKLGSGDIWPHTMYLNNFIEYQSNIYLILKSL